MARRYDDYLTRRGIPRGRTRKPRDYGPGNRYGGIPFQGGGTARPTPPPTRIAYGTYDPQLDQQLGAARRGFGDLKEDLGIQESRQIQDYGFATGDVERGYGRSLADLLTNRGRAGEDYNRSVGNVKLNYSRLANAQAQAQNAGGVLGGAIEQAKAKRAANQAREIEPITESFGRFQADSALTEERMGEDKSTDLGRLLTGLERGEQDRDITQTRGGRELKEFRQDIRELKAFQAAQQDLLAPPPSQHPDNDPPDPNRGKGKGRGKSRRPGNRYGGIPYRGGGRL